MENSVLHTFCSKSGTFQFARNISKVAQSMITWYYIIANELPGTYLPNIRNLDQILILVLKTGQYCITFYPVPIREFGVYSFILPQHFLESTQYFFRLAKMGRHNRTRPWSAHESRLQADPIFHMRKKHWEGLIQVI